LKRIFNFRKAKSIGSQISSLRSHFPNLVVTFLGHNGLRVVGDISPTARSIKYNFELTYVIKGKPILKIINPKLTKNFKNEEIPHIYPDNSLCLYRPKYGEFTGADFLSETIIPWASLWLYYYEVWHITGEWLGGGEHIATK
jgi:hypothetical protein